MVKEPRTPKSSQVTTLAARPAPLENCLAGFGLRDGGPSTPPSAPTSASQPWAPSHLPPADLHFLNHPKFRDRLTGVCWAGCQRHDAQSSKREVGPPRSLCLAGMAGGCQYSAASQQFPRSVRGAHRPFLPIGSVSSSTTTPGTSQRYLGTWMASWSTRPRRFKSSKKMVLGLLTPLFPTAGKAQDFVPDLGQVSSRDVQQHIRRLGTAIMMRVMERKETPGLRAALFCPWDRHQFIKNSWKKYDWRLMLWKGNFIKAVRRGRPRKRSSSVVVTLEAPSW
ncbi:hypothetical protein N657DRAFT_837 [Parathielavia appendiculata]|uniref:Uncharacterized protein n=1 Tax=Parathielavia appendiculata TaxID=2587402 RepID=A0AAN6U7S1_9PEZI|nr:hypothetical protein N657DRAFT_837 [Parathielavia appendiculata]